MGNAYVVLYIYGPPRFLKDGRYFPLIDRVYARKISKTSKILVQDVSIHLHFGLKQVSMLSFKTYFSNLFRIQAQSKDVVVRLCNEVHLQQNPKHWPEPVVKYASQALSSSNSNTKMVIIRILCTSVCYLFIFEQS